jgi:putative transposase
MFHKISREIVNKMIENHIGTIIVGYNKGWKDSIRIGKRNNQIFVGIPFYDLISKLSYKCEKCGITFITREESYTSKCDALAMEPIGRHDSYSGKRIKRGLYQSSVGKTINADVNGALNIMRKVIGDSYPNEIIDSGRLFRPIKCDIL